MLWSIKCYDSIFWRGITAKGSVIWVPQSPDFTTSASLLYDEKQGSQS